MAEAEDVVVYHVKDDERQIGSWGRDTLSVATEFCRRPKWPARLSDHFVGVDDWGSGSIVCATPSLSNWIGKAFSEFRRAVRAGEVSLEAQLHPLA